MKKYIYLWINQYRAINGYSEADGYFFDDLGISLSSEYIVNHTFKRGMVNEGEDDELKFFINRTNESYDENFYSENVKDLKVIVGNNGAGKTTLLRLLSDIIAQNNIYSAHTEYVLLYEENCKIYKHIHLNEEKRKNEKEVYKLGKIRELKIENNEIEKLDLSHDINSSLNIFYSPCFNGNDLNFHNYVDKENFKDISTDALLFSHQERFLNPHTDGVEYYKKSEHLAYYSMMEQNWLIDFALNVGDEFKEIVSIPKLIKMEISDQAVDAALSDFAVAEHKFFNLVDVIYNSMDAEDHEYWEKEFEDAYHKWLEKLPYGDRSRDAFSAEFKYDQSAFILSIKKSWLRFYRSLSNIEDVLRFAALMSHFRTFNSNSTKGIEKLNLSLFDFSSENYLRNDSLWSQNEELKRIHNQIEMIIESLKNNYMWIEGKIIYFHIEQNNEALKKINNIYGKIYKLTDFVTFSFARSMSSGENQFIRFYARMFGILKDVSILKPINQIYLYIDEAELYMHPEWQRRWLDTLLKMLKVFEKTMWTQYDQNSRPIMEPEKKLKVQFFIATHSPFMLTDCLNENILRLKRSENFGKVFCVIDDSKTMAGNILDILQTGFFLNSTMGYLAEKKVDLLIKKIKNHQVTANEKKILDCIGDPIMKALIKRKING